MVLSNAGGRNFSRLGGFPQPDRDRGRSLIERNWLDQFLEHVPRNGTVLDLGCGIGEPIARYIIGLDRHVLGVDSSEAMIRMCRARFPESEWLVGDMREVEFTRQFDGVIAWDSFFHLGVDDQRAMFPKFAKFAKPGAPLLFTSGTSHGEVIGSYEGEPLYHASLDPDEYNHLLQVNGFTVRNHQAEDPDCGDHTVWLATKG